MAVHDRLNYITAPLRDDTSQQQVLMTIAFVTVLRAMMTEVGETSHLASMVEVEIDEEEEGGARTVAWVGRGG